MKNLLRILSSFSLLTTVAAEAGRSQESAFASRPPVVEPRPVSGATHVIVNKPAPGRAFGWPANGGIWSWGNEILVMYLDCPYQDHPGFSNHDSDQEHSSARWVTSRSTDGGQTWTEHRTAFPDPRANRRTLKPRTLTTPMDFSDPNTIVNFHWDSLQPGARTYFYYSTDRGRTFQGPFDNIPLFDSKAMTGRTDYEVTGGTTSRRFSLVRRNPTPPGFASRFMPSPPPMAA